jgi:cytidine deaminase
MISHSDQLYAAAAALIKQRYTPKRHVIAAAAMGASGKIYTAVNLDCYLRRAAVCAEGAVITMAMTAGESGITDILALRYDPEKGEPWLVSPCGVCRELILDYGEGAQIYLPDGQGGVQTMTVADILPNRYAKEGKQSR